MAMALLSGLAMAASHYITTGTFVWGLVALGAGLSLAMRALAPKLDTSQMGGATATVREPAVARKIIYGKVRAGGAIVFLDTSGDSNKYLHMVIAFAGHEIESYEEVYFGDRKVWTASGGYQGSWADYAELNFHKGDQTTADSNLVSRSSKWDADNKLLDTAYIYVRLKWDAEEYQGVPNITALIKGKKVYNPVSGVTAWTDNPALCVRDYLVDSKYGMGESASKIDSTALSAAISKCDETITLSDSTTEKRYTLNGVVDTGNTRKTNIELMLTSMGGKLVYSGGSYFIKPAYYVSPVVTIDESVMAGEIQVQTKQSRRSLYNGVKGSFISSEENYIVADYPTQKSSTYATADGEELLLDMPLPYTTTHTAAQRLAKMVMLQSRFSTAIVLPCNLAALKLKAGDNVMVTNAKMGYTNKVFEVMDYQIEPKDDGEIVVLVNALETSSAIYDWNTSDEEDFTTGGEIDLYDGLSAEPPTSLSLAKSTTINDDGTAIENIVATWTASDDVFVDKYEVEWSTDNTVFTGVVTDGTRFTIENVIAAQTYYVRVRGVNNLGVKSTYATANITASGDTTAPAVPTSLAATAGYQQIRINWINPSDNDFSHVEIQRREAGGSFASIASVAGGRGEAAEFVSAGLDDETQYFHRIRSVDYSGNTSAYITAVSATTEAAPETPRTNHGYVYYSIASATQPATPTATSYNYDTNTFSGLSLYWKVNPDPTQANENKYWAASFTISEATYGGTQTITFSTPFISHFFEGLVNFTNLNDEISDSGSTRITTINGGLIKTGTLEADRIRIDGVGIDTETVGGETSLIIGDGGVTNAKISGAIQSTAYSSGTAGWKIDKDGDAEFNDAVFRGTLTAASGTLGDINLPTGGDIRSGQTAFNTGTGFFLGNVGGTPKFSIGSSTGNRMTWDGTDLQIVGAKKVVTAGNEAFAVASRGGSVFNNTSFQKVAEIAIGVEGSVKVIGSIAGGNSSTTAYGQFRKNGSSFYSFSKGGTGYQDFTYSSISVTSGDKLQLYIATGSNQTTFWGTFGIYTEDGADAAVTLQVG